MKVDEVKTGVHVVMEGVRRISWRCRKQGRDRAKKVITRTGGVDLVKEGATQADQMKWKQPQIKRK